MLDDILYTTGVISVLWLAINMEHITGNMKMYMFRMWENNKNKTLNDLAMAAFWNCSYAYTFVKYRCGRLYSTFPLVRSFVDAFGGPKKAKPVIEYPWASITRLIEAETGNLRVVEDKFDLTDFEWQNKSISENLLKLNHMCVDVLQNNPNTVECLLLVAENATGVRSRVINHANMDMETDISMPINMANVKFLLMDYVHPEHEDSYELVVDKTYFMEGNHILSGAFVGRLLSKQGYSGAFDTSYRVVIIDQDVNTVEWSYTDFVEVAGDKKYEVRRYEEAPVEEPAQPVVSSNSSIEDDETKSWDKVDND